MSIQRKALLIFCIPTLVLILSGCLSIISSELSINIGLQETWTFEIIITPTQGYEEAVTNTLNSELANTQDELKNKGITLDIAPQSKTPEGYVPIKATMKGKGYDLLNEVLGSSVITVDASTGQRMLYFNLDLGGDFAAFPTTFALSGGKILSHNGVQVNDRTVTWSNYSGTIQATMAEPSLLDYWLYAAIALIAGIFVLFVIFLFAGISKLNKAKVSRTQPRVQAKTCPQCGSTIPAHAVFCPNCGSQQRQKGE